MLLYLSKNNFCMREDDLYVKFNNDNYNCCEFFVVCFFSTENNKHTKIFDFMFNLVKENPKILFGIVNVTRNKELLEMIDKYSEYNFPIFLLFEYGKFTKIL